MEIIGVILGIVYVGGIWKFWSGYLQTNFSRNLLTKISLSLLWPALLLINPAYRKNFQKALKGRN
jgi:hypothetical protein